MKNITKELRDFYLSEKQWLNFESHYEDDGKLTEQQICIILPDNSRCILCVRIQTYSNLYDYELGSKPYLQFDPNYHEYTVTIPKFKYLTKEDIALALRTVVKDLSWLIFNIKLDGVNILEYINIPAKRFTLDREDLKMLKEYKKEK